MQLVSGHTDTAHLQKKLTQMDPPEKQVLEQGEPARPQQELWLHPHDCKTAYAWPGMQSIYLTVMQHRRLRYKMKGMTGDYV